MISTYRFHVYCHIRRILKILEIPLPNQYNYPYNHENFVHICSEYKVSDDLTEWRSHIYFTTWQSRAWETGKPDTSYINEDTFSRWIIEKSDGLTKIGLQKSSEAIRDYADLILTSQTSMRGQIICHTARNFDAQQIFLNTFENVIRRKVDIP